MELGRSCFLETENTSNRVVDQIWNGDWDKVIISYTSITQASWRMLRKIKYDPSFRWPSVKMCVHLLSKRSSAWRRQTTFLGNSGRLTRQGRALNVPLSLFSQSLGNLYTEKQLLYSFSTGVATIALSGHKSLINMFPWFSCYLLFNNCPIKLKWMGYLGDISHLFLLREFSQIFNNTQLAGDTAAMCFTWGLGQESLTAVNRELGDCWPLNTSYQSLCWISLALARLLPSCAHSSGSALKDYSSEADRVREWEGIREKIDSWEDR